MSCTSFTSLHQTCDRPTCRFFLPEILITAYTPKSEPFLRWINDLGKATYRFASYHQTGYSTSHPLGILGLLCAEGKKKHLSTASYRLAKLETRVLVRNPFFRTRSCGQGDQETYRKGRESRSFSYTRPGTTTYTSRSSIDQLAKTPT